MIRLYETIDVDRPPDEAFAWTADFANIEQWDPGVAASRKTSAGAVGVGTTYVVDVRFGPRRIPMDYVIRVFDPPRRVVLEGRSASVHAIDDIRFEPVPVGNRTGTRITYTAEISLLGALARIEPWMKGTLGKVGKDAVAGLKAALTADATPPARSAWTDLADRLILPGLVGFTHLGYRRKKRAWKALSVSLRGRTAVVTGATSGLGRAAARQLAALGARVVLVGRDAARAEAARRDIVAETGNDDVAVALADLSLLADVRRLARSLLATEPRIDILVNNAGVLLNERTMTAEGLETTLATNLLAPFLLTQLLLPRLAASAKPSAPARIVNVSSGGMYTTGVKLDDLQYERRPWNGSDAYARTKRALVILTELWAERLRGRGVVVHAMHPGWADTPGVATSLPGFHALTRPLLRSADEGADTITWLAASPQAAEASGWFWLDREPHTTHVLRGTEGTPEERRRLWNALVALTGEGEAEP
jgi:NAD(P)-dependent dehydrogenase (short-subunit alcohol dehydrogenase family)/carbon monoxide dehydrogenase subunit G